MKKLMIAAAVAAMAGGAFAAEYVYDFNATLKTTSSRMGKVTLKVDLGTDSTGTNFWYNDSAITQYLDSVKKVGGVVVPTISDAVVKADPDVQSNLLNLAFTYNRKSAGLWCASFQWPEENCYRVAGSAKLKEVFFQDDCCDDSVVYENFAFTNDVTDSSIVYQEHATAIGTPLFQHFGSLLNTKANKIEIYAPVVIKDEGAVEVFDGWLAGQGTVAWNKNNDQLYVNTISGNIVGTLPAPDCEHCCSLPTKSYAFDCAGMGELPYTAGFGTFRLKINKKLSTF